MSNFIQSCKRKFPNNWQIMDKGNGLFHFRDNQISRGKGFLVVVQEENHRYEVTLNFENFAKDLSDYAQKQISSTANPLRKLFESDCNLTAIHNKQYIETNLDPQSLIFDNWNFNLFYKKTDVYNDEDRFSDILISFILFIFPYEVEAEEEGSSTSVLLTKYERSHLNRSLCLAYHGYNCKACNVNLKEKYGDIARNFIHIHHLNPISLAGTIIPDPIIDFVPLCPNCHAIAHLQNPPLIVTEIQNLLKINGSQDIQ